MPKKTTLIQHSNPRIRVTITDDDINNPNTWYNYQNIPISQNTPVS